jgi:serine/threonine-protein kinase
MSESELFDTESREPTPTLERRLGRYVLHYVLGRGGMGTVFLSRLVGEEGFERWVAVKQLHEHLADKPKTVNMFLDEARTSARLNHPHVVQVTDFGVEGRIPYLVMEYVNGENLSLLNGRFRKKSSHIPFALASWIIARACEGLHHAHELTTSAGKPLELVHRDVSPQNILISYDGIVKVTDFGIAKVADRSLSFVEDGVVRGKIAYMSPEQARNKSIDRRSDIFALGILLYETTLGRRLFRVKNPRETLLRIAEVNVERPKSINPLFPSELEVIIRRALSRDPNARYQTSREMQRDLDRYVTSTGEDVTTAELADFMAQVCKDRLAIRRDKLRAIPEEGSIRLDTGEELFSSPSLSMTSGDVARRQPSRPSSRFRRSVTALAIVLLCLLGLATAYFFGFGWPMGDNGSLFANRAVSVISSVEAGGHEGDANSPGGKSTEIEPAALTAAPLLGPDAGDIDAAADEADGGRSGDGDLEERSAKRPSTTPRTKVPRPSKASGTVNVMATPWCDVYLGSRRLGRTPIIGRAVPSGRYVLRLLPLGKGPAHRRTVVVREGELTPINVNLSE